MKELNRFLLDLIFQWKRLEYLKYKCALNRSNGGMQNVCLPHSINYKIMQNLHLGVPREDEGTKRGKECSVIALSPH